MYQGHRILGLIPARGGSKGLPGKNILPLQGKPLIAWTIEEALASQYLDRVVVSTDDRAIADVASRYGAEVPFMRPEELASDTATSIDVLFHGVGWFEKRGEPFDLVMLLQPTSPLRPVSDMDEAVRFFFRRGAKAVISLCRTDHHPYWENTLPPDGNMKDFLRAGALNRNRQTLPDFYRINGALYLGEVGYLREQKGFFGDLTYGYVMPRERSIDIDDRLDFMIAGLLLGERIDHV